MALNDLELSLMVFPQRWTGSASQLSINVLLLPVGDPTAPLGSGPKFAGAMVPLTFNVVSGLASLPTTTTAAAQSIPFLATPPPVAPTLFTTLYGQLVAKGITVTSKKLAVAPPAAARIKKSLPPSYTQAFPFEMPRSTDVSVGSGYCCALRNQAPTQLNPTLPGPDTSIAWGQVLSYAMRQPALAQDMGLVYSVTLNVSAGILDEGGWIYVTLDPSSPGNPWVSDWKTNPDTVKSYAARLPQITSSDARPLFAATLLPIVATPSSNLAEAQKEAEEYDDGFAQVVHSNQPTTIDAATLETNQISPATDTGVQIGWDDEQVTIWFNNQVDLLRDRVNATSNTPEAPLGVQGYRVDVRPKGATQWQSLCLVNGTLPFDQNSYGSPATTSINGTEFWIAPAPVRPSTNDNSTNDQEAWLPLYFAQWAGASLVLPDPVVQLLAYAANAYNTPAGGNPITIPSPPNPNANLASVPVLLYGNDYEFRVRLADLTGGGPLATDMSVHPGQAPITQLNFRRYLPPKSLLVVSSPPIPPPPANPPSTRTITTLAVQRPRINYPEAILAGVDPATFSLSNLANLIEDAWANNGVVSVPDPDVDSFDVRVEARIPAHDTGTAGIDPGDMDGNFRVIYSVNVPFPSGSDDPTVTLSLNYTDGVDDISTVAAPPSGTTTLPIPTARNIRVRLYPRCAAKANYYGTDEPPIGLSSDYIVRQEASTEDALIPSNPQSQLQAFYFQPGSNIPQLLAQQLGLNQQDLTFSGPTGVRTVFGASSTLRHTISADLSSITFSNETELLGQWIVALVLDLERDWTWDGFGSPPLQFTRDGSSIGVIRYPRVVSPSAAGTPGHKADRSYSQIIFFDSINPAPAAGTFPKDLNPIYTVTGSFAAANPQTFILQITLPITTSPVQTPKIASTGLAESPYVHSDDYSSTSPRDRYLWIEFDQPIADPEDTYFGRVLAHGPDPLLAASLFPQPEESEMLPESVEPVLPIEAEPIRAIFSGQSADYSGLDAMTQLVAANSTGVGQSGTFYLLPLPTGISSEDLELFGFWTYEFRVGHLKNWSTAQGRYGRPLRVTGIQHPSPHLTCSVTRAADAISVTAPYANTVYNGQPVYNFQNGDPQTRIWFMLYAQVLQADRATDRNILLNHRLGNTIRPNPNKFVKFANPQHSFNRDPQAGIQFPQDYIAGVLRLLGLPSTSSLSVLAVEVLPGPLNIETGPAGGGLNLAQAPSNGSRGAEPAQEATAEQERPLGADLGLRRVLRTSPLTAVPSIC